MQEAIQRIPLTRMDCHDGVLMERILNAISAVAHAGQFTLGEEVERFEREFAEYCQARHAVGVASGTEALALALRALEIGPGQEVIVPANSFIATAEAVSLVGATPRFVDVDPFTHTVTPETVAPAMNRRTAAVIVVHLYGRTVDVGPIIELARVSNLRVIEDACQAHGARYHGRRVGTLADIGCFSFYPAKNLGAWGDGGAVTTNDDSWAEHTRLLRSHGERPRYCHNIIGTTSRLDAIQAAVLRVKLRSLDAWNAARRQLAARLTEDLADIPVSRPAAPVPGMDHVYHQYVITTRARDALRAHLKQRGIATAIHYPVPIHRSPAYVGSGTVRLPVAEKLAEHVCSLPMFPAMTEAELAGTVESIRSFDWNAVLPTDRPFL
jgi:dTDP-3-amino-3,4,6-trideoxy-alpha-D-glucose transaminase